MKTNCRHEVVARITRRSLALAALLALPFFGGDVTRAQSTATPAPTVAAKPSSAPSVPTPVAVQAPVPEPTPPSSKGSHEGITVHGHWMIEVRNPDGSVDKHLEFENSICPTQTDSTSGVTFPGGALALSLFATGQATPGAWMIVLGNKSAVNKTAGVPPGCVAMGASAVLGVNSGFTLIQNTLLAGQSPEALIEICALQCFTNLVVATPAASSPTITLSGEIPTMGQSFGTLGTAQNQGGEIDTVSAGNVLCMNTLGTTFPAECPNVFPQNSAILTGTQLTPPVTWTPGQAVSVKVVISFGSGS